MKTLHCLALLGAGAVFGAAQTTTTTPAPRKTATVAQAKPATKPSAAMRTAPVHHTASAKTAAPGAAFAPGEKLAKGKLVVAAHHPSGAPMQIPAGATEAADGTFHYTDSAGKSWSYRKTPFGISRAPEGGISTAVNSPVGNTRTPFGITKTSPVKAAPVQNPENKNAQVTAVASGDTVVFRRATPFGASSWTKNKSDLTEDEKAIWEREQAKGNQ